MKEKFNLRRTTKRTLSVLMAVLMVMSVWVFVEPTKAEALTFTDYFYVPETIYLKAGDRKTFQYYVNRSQDTTGALKAEAAATTGLIYFQSNRAASVKITVSGATISPTSFSVTGTTLKGTITSGSLSSAISTDGNNCTTLTWTATITGTDGNTYTQYAYTVCYAPNRNVTAAGATGFDYNSSETYASTLIWLQGVHNAGTAAINTTNGDGTSGHSATGYQVVSGDRYLDPLVNGTTISGNKNPGNYRTSTSPFTGATKSMLTCNCVAGENRDGDGDWVSHNVHNTGYATLTVDTSRYTNLNQVPNVKLGFAITDLEHAKTRRTWYVSDFTGKTTTSSKSKDTLIHRYYRSDDNSKDLYANAVGTVLGGSTATGSDASDGKTIGVKYNKPINLTLSGKGTDRRYYKGGATSVADSSYAMSICSIGVNIVKVDKSTLRATIDAAQKWHIKERYTSATWDTYVAALREACGYLGNPQATQTEIDNANTKLTNARNGLKSTITFKNGKCSENGVTPSNVTITSTTSNWDNTNKVWTIDMLNTSKVATNSLTISFNSSGGGVITASATGYDFKGWNTTNGATSGTTGSFTFSGSETRYATWSAHTYGVAFNANGGSGTMADQTGFTYDVSKALSANAFTRTGYTFAGWAASASGSVVYANKASVKNLTSTDGATVILYAKWTPITYTVAYNGNGSTSGSETSSSHTYDTAKNLTTNAFKKEYTVTYNYNGATGGNSTASEISASTFAGWNTKSDGTGTSYADKASVKNLSSTNGATVNLYAKWNSGSVTLPTPTKTGYTFDGWFTDSALTKSAGTGGASYSPTENITLYAKWNINKYTATFKNADGTTISTSTVNYGVKPTVPDNPTREPDDENHYTFKAWSNGSITYTKDNVPAMGASNVTYTATYTATKHNWSNTKTIVATCTETGLKEYQCVYCSATKTEIIPINPNNHSWGSWSFDGATEKTHSRICERNSEHKETVSCSFNDGVVIKGATCSQTGEKKYTCSVCKGTYTETIEKTAHTIVTDPAVAPTTENVGFTAGSHCDACKKVLVAQTVIAPLAKSEVYEGAITSKIEGSFIGVTKDEPTIKVSTTALTAGINATGNYGKVTISNNKAIYKVTTMQVEGADTFWLLSTKTAPANNAGITTVYSYQKITVIPADRLYYEDTFETGDNSGITFSEGWTSVGTATDNAVSQLEDKTFEEAYNSCLAYSAGNAKKVTVSTKPWPYVEFTFAGTGFDIISATSASTGAFTITVTQGENTVQKKVVDTYYGYEYGELHFDETNHILTLDKSAPALYEVTESDEFVIRANGKYYSTNATGNIAKGWIENPANGNALYQVPIISLDGLAYGVYTVKVEARYSSMFDHAKSGSYDLIFDAVRIHNPGGNTVDSLRTETNTYISIREKAEINGNVLVDGAEVIDVKESDVLKVSPNNELYISKGQSLAFELNKTGCNDVLVGMRSINGSPVSVTIVDSNKNTKTVTVSTATELYYSISEMSGTVTIRNNGNGILSLTNLKAVTEKGTSQAKSYMSVSAETAPRALAMLRMIDSDLSINPEAIETATDDSGKITLTVKTSSDVANLIIYDADGNEITADEINSIANGDEITWTVTLTATESRTYTYSIQGAYENGYVSEDPVEITVKVELPETAPEVTLDDEEEPGKKLTLFELIIRIIKRIIYKAFGISYE